MLVLCSMSSNTQSIRKSLSDCEKEFNWIFICFQTIANGYINRILFRSLFMDIFWSNCLVKYFDHEKFRWSQSKFCPIDHQNYGGGGGV